MKLNSKVLVSIIVTIAMMTGGVAMVPCYGDSGNITYEQYSSKDSELNLVMDYVAGWRYNEHRGSYGSYAQVQFYGDVKGDFAPSFVVTVKRSSKVDFEPLTIQGMADDIIAKKMKLKGAEVLSRGQAELSGGVPAMDISLAYQKPDELRSLDPEWIPFRERIIIFQKDDKFYTLRYMNPQEEFDAFEGAFLHCVKTLRIK